MDQSNDSNLEPPLLDCALVQGDILSRILSYLSWKETVRCREVSTQWRETVYDTPVRDILISSPSMAENLQLISRCLPKLQALQIRKQTEMDDYLFRPSFFEHLKELDCRDSLGLCNSFSEILPLKHLQALNLHGNENLKWKLSNLAAFPNLEDLRCINSRSIAGDLKDLSVFSRQMVVLDVSGCGNVTGNLMDVAQWSKLWWFGMSRTKIEGDLRKIRPGDFPALEMIGLDHHIYGASEIQRISHAPEIMKARHQISKQSSQESPIFPVTVLGLSTDSPDYHERIEQRLYTSERDPPFCIENVIAGDRRGWRWSNYLGGCCDIRWLDPEPDAMQDEERYKNYTEELALILQTDYDRSIFTGFLDPPTPEEYENLCREK